MSSSGRILVLGSREFRSYPQFDKTLRSVFQEIGRPRVLISGQYVGTDSMTEVWSIINNVPYRLEGPDVDRFGAKAEDVFVQDVLSTCNGVIAFPMISSDNVWNMLDHAHSLSMQDIFVYPVERRQ